MRAAIVIPTYEEAGNIAVVLPRVRAAAPDAHVLVAGVWAPLPGDERDREEFERLAAVVVTGFRERGHSMRFLDATDLLAPHQLADGLHPNAAGYRAITEMWERGILDCI